MEKGEDRMCAVACPAAVRHIFLRWACVLYSVTDEPALAWIGARAPAPGASRSSVVHYPAKAISSHLHAVHEREIDEKLTGKFVLLSALEPKREYHYAHHFARHEFPGDPHRHNAVALTLCLEGENVYSMVDGERSDWHSVITPPTALHSHHNEGNKQMLSLVAQDGGLFYNRAVGFSFD